MNTFFVSLVQATRNKYKMTFTGQLKIWPEVKVRPFTNEVVGYGHAAYQTTRLDQASSLIPLAFVLHIARWILNIIYKNKHFMIAQFFGDLSTSNIVIATLFYYSYCELIF